MFKSKFLSFYVICVLVLVATLVGACAKPAAAPPPTTTVAPAPAPKTTAAPAPTSTPTASPTAVKPIEISMTMIIPQTNDQWQKAVLVWTQNIETASGGRVKFLPAFAGGVAKLDASYQAVIDGIADMAYVPISAQRGRAPLAEMGMLPPANQVLYTRPSRVFWELLNAVPEFKAEFNETRLLAMVALPLNTFLTRTKITSLEDFKGKIIISGASDQVKALGGTTSSISWGEGYLALQKGTIDGILPTSIDTVGFKFGEAAKFKLINAPIMASNNQLYMNIKKWNSLPADIQAIIEKYSGAAFADLYDQALNAAEAANKEIAIKQMGVQYNALSDTEAARWAALIEPTRKDKAAAVDKLGKPGTKWLAEYDRLVGIYSK